MKRNTLNRKRRLTAAQKRILSAAGFDPTQYLYATENDYYLLVVNKYTDDRYGVPKIKNAPPGVRTTRQGV